MNPNNPSHSLRTLTFCALLVAMSIVFSRVLSISTGFLRFNLSSLPVVLAAVLFGPGAGFVVGALADAIGGVLAGYAINPLITLGAGAVGFFAGWGWRRLPARTEGLRLAGGILLGHMVGSMVLNSLALYLFTSNKRDIRRIMNRIRFGGGCVNDTIIHLATSRMGFGGTGQSGMGSYHGKDGFDTFSHYKSVVDKKTWLDLPFRYHPFSPWKDKMIKKFLK